MNKSPKYINVIETIEVNGSYLEEHRRPRERRKTLKVNFNYYERRLRKHRRFRIQLDIKV
jgi:hypothetical protein